MSVGVSGAVHLPKDCWDRGSVVAPCTAGLAGAILAHFPGNSHLGPATVCKGAFHCAGSIKFIQEHE